MRRLLKPLWILLALLFLLEAWLWDRLEPIVQRIVDVTPWRAFKARVAAAVDHLSPRASLAVLAIPAVLYSGVELLALIPLAEGRWVFALAILTVAKIIGAAITAFVFDVTKPKIMEIEKFRQFYATVMGWRDWAHRLADPYIVRTRAWIYAMRGRYSGSTLAFLERLRRRVRASFSR